MEQQFKINNTTVAAAPKKLTVSQRMRIRVRRHMLRRHGYLPSLIACMALIIAMLLVGFFPPGNAVSPLAEDYPNRGFQLSFVGDINLGRYIGTYGAEYGYKHFFEGVSPIWANSDYIFANLECAVLQREESEYVKDKKNIHLYAYAETDAIIEMQRSGINAISYANNHSHDYGSEAFREAVAFFDSIGLNYSGTTLKFDERGARQLSIQLITEDGTRIGFIGVTNVVYEGLGTGSGMLTSGHPSLFTSVYEAHAENDLTVVYVHWGVEYNNLPSTEQVELGHKLIDAGADIVIGAHPHCLQPIEKYGNGIIFYSLGNFIMDQNNSFTRDSVILQYNQSADGSRYFELVPVRVNDGKPEITDNSFYCSRIRKVMTKFLHDTEYMVTEDGHIIIQY